MCKCLWARFKGSATAAAAADRSAFAGNAEEALAANHTHT